MLRELTIIFLAGILLVLGVLLGARLLLPAFAAQTGLLLGVGGAGAGAPVNPAAGVLLVNTGSNMLQATGSKLLVSVTGGPPSPSVPVFDHVVLVIEENHGYNQIVGSAQAPYINNTLIVGGALMTNSFAVSHPSEPNYFALWSGSTQGIVDDGNYTENGPSLGGQLKAASITVKGYVEDVAQRKHDPWESFTDSAGIGVNFSTWPAGPDFSSLPKFSVVIPNLTDDMHDGTIAQGDTWLSNHIAAYASWALTHNSLLIVTFDEDETTPSENNHIMTVFYGANVAPGTYSQGITHYDVLATIEAMFGLAKLGNAAGLGFIDVWYCP
jgi:phosphatidylinositol-3-phosphatase